MRAGNGRHDGHAARSEGEARVEAAQLRQAAVRPHEPSVGARVREVDGPLAGEVTEPGVLFHVRMPLQHRDGLPHILHLASHGQPRGVERAALRASELRQPDRLAVLPEGVDVIPQEGRIACVGVDRDSVDLATRANMEEVVVPPDGVIDAVEADGRADDPGQPKLRGQVLHLRPEVHGLLGRHVRLAVEVRLVEGQERAILRLPTKRGPELLGHADRAPAPQHRLPSDARG
mmetsp:Transcript_97442/g.280420  ORF Transcript_97442/g.280420 Transcript_97442/m.280420 type:complete len:232 (+) Transcript_97442:51-746(+)